MRTCSLIYLSTLLVVSFAIEYQCVNSGGNAGLLKDFCETVTVDAALYLPSQQTYVFQGNMVVLRLTNGSVAWGYPKRIDQEWPGAPSYIDAIFTHTASGKTYMLKGSQYWSFTNFTLEEGCPNYISKGFNGIPNNVDAATEWDSRFIYFFKGDMYYRYDPCKNETIKVPMTDFSTVPNNVTAVFRNYHYTSGTIGFFKGEILYTYSIASNMITALAINRSWIGCKF